MQTERVREMEGREIERLGWAGWKPASVLHRWGCMLRRAGRPPDGWEQRQLSAGGRKDRARRAQPMHRAPPINTGHRGGAGGGGVYHGPHSPEETPTQAESPPPPHSPSLPCLFFLFSPTQDPPPKTPTTHTHRGKPWETNPIIFLPSLQQGALAYPRVHCRRARGGGSDTTDWLISRCWDTGFSYGAGNRVSHNGGPSRNERGRKREKERKRRLTEPEPRKDKKSLICYR